MKKLWSSLFLLAALLGFGRLSVILASSPVLAQLPSDQPTSDAYQRCQAAAASVVTLYSGKEIGAGSVISANGLILTNFHVVKESVRTAGRTKTFVKLANTDRYEGTVLGTDQKNDLALVQIAAAEPLWPIRFADASKIQPGQPVCAIGSPFGRTGVLTQGTLLGFRENNDLRSSVRLSGGNSGGPLLNAQGDLIGVNKSIWVENGRNTGISFAVNVRTAQEFIARTQPVETVRIGNPQPSLMPLMASNRIPAIAPAPTTQPSQREISARLDRAELGVILDRANLIVRQVQVGSVAAMAGIQPNDRLIAIDGQPIRQIEALQAFLTQRPAVAIFTIDRNQRQLNLQVNF
jgi:serine protease Do